MPFFQLDIIVFIKLIKHCFNHDLNKIIITCYTFGILTKFEFISHSRNFSIPVIQMRVNHENKTVTRKKYVNKFKKFIKKLSLFSLKNTLLKIHERGYLKIAAEYRCLVSESSRHNAYDDLERKGARL